MKYRVNRRTGDKISEIGIGSSYMFEAGMTEAVKALRRAVEGGINYFDLAAGNGKTFPIYGEALHDLRKSIFFQIHFGADYSKGTYGWSLNLDTMVIIFFMTIPLSILLLLYRAGIAFFYSAGWMEVKIIANRRAISFLSAVSDPRVKLTR